MLCVQYFVGRCVFKFCVFNAVGYLVFSDGLAGYGVLNTVECSVDVA